MSANWRTESEWKLQIANGLALIQKKCPGMNLPTPTSIVFDWETHRFISDAINIEQRSFPRIVINF